MNNENLGILHAHSVEITAKDRDARAAAIRHMPPGSEVFIADLPDQTPEVVREAARDLRGGGLEPVPHLVARNIPGLAVLDELLAALRADAGVTRVLLTGGDRDSPVGDFASALNLLRTGLLPRHGIRRVAFAAFPEGHPRIGTETLEEALRLKVAEAVAAGMDVFLVSQFVFEAEPVLDFIRRLRGMGIDAPLRAGTAGPTRREVLLDFGRDLGAGPSLALVQRMAEGAHYTPDAYLAALSKGGAQGPEGLHLFPFGSAEECLTWAARHLDHDLR